jgi:predicted aconitase
MKIENPNELDLGMLGFFAGKIADSSVSISGVNDIDRRSCKSLCGGMGTSGRCGKFILEKEDKHSEKVDFDKKEMQKVYDELNTTDSSDLITLGSPQLGLEELSDLSMMLKGKSFQKRCMIFCPRAIQNQARNLGYIRELEHAGCEILSDCCTCLTPLIDKKDVDGVTTNSIKGAYYLKNSNGVDVNLKSLSKIIQEETR